MLILGIESSCDETAAGVVEDGRVLLGSSVSSQIEEHRIYGGVVPEIASRRHVENIVPVTREALRQAGAKIEDLDGIAVTYAPGLIGALLVGVNFAKALSLSAGKRLIPVNHIRGHIASLYLSHRELKPPFLCLIVSGGHTNIVKVGTYTEMDILARTRDDAAGEAFDKAARAMGIPYPGGVELDKIAEDGDETAFPFPKPRVAGAPLDFSFSGLKTSVLNLLNSLRQRGEEPDVPDICASYRRAVVDYLTEHFLNAAQECGMKTLAVAGGVSANSLLRRELPKLAAENGMRVYFPKPSLTGDNGAMIASQGYYELLSGNTAGMELNAAAQAEVSD